MRFPKPNNIVAEKYVAGMSLFKSKLAKIKLSANESALGPSPRARKQYLKVSEDLSKEQVNKDQMKTDLKEYIKSCI